MEAEEIHIFHWIMEDFSKAMLQIINQKEELLDLVNQDQVNHFIKLVQMVPQENVFHTSTTVQVEMDT